MRILLVKLSSMGDVIHNFPVVTDILRVRPDTIVDWVTEAMYRDLVALHPGVTQKLEVHLRWIKKHFWRDAPWFQHMDDRQALVQEDYDEIIDTQGLIKSVMVARWATGRKNGYARVSAREPFSARFHDRTFEIGKEQHAVERNRQLAAAALDYRVEGPPDYGIVAPTLTLPWCPQGRYAVLLHASSRANKQWPRAHWIALGRTLQQRGVTLVLPWGKEIEKQESEAMARELPGAVVPPKMSFPEAASLLAGASAVVGVDTGLAHLAVALGRPTLGLYLTTQPARTGLYGGIQTVNLGGGDVRRPALPDADEAAGIVLPWLD